MARNVAILATSQLVTGLLSSALLLTLPVYLGVTALGRFAFAQSVCQAISALAVMGTDFYVVRQVAADRRRLASLVWSSLSVRVVVWALATAVAAGLFWLRAAPGTTLSVFLAFSLVTLVTMVNSVLAAALVGLELMGRKSAAAMAGAVVSLLVGLPLVMATHSPLLLCGALGLGMLVTLVVNLRHFQRARLPYVLPNLKALKQLFSGAAPFIGLAVVQGVYSQAATIILGLFAGVVAVGRYSSADRFSPVVLLVAVVLVAALLPALTRLHTNADEDAAAAFRKVLDVALLVVIPAGVGVSLVAARIYASFYPAAFAPAIPVLQVMGLSWILTSLAMILAAGVAALDLQRKYLIRAAAIACVLLLSSVFLILAFQAVLSNGALGAAVASATCELLMVVAAARLLPSGFLGWPAAIQVLRVVGAAAVMAMVAILLSHAPLPAEIAAAAAAYALAAVVLGAVHTDELRLALSLVRPRRGGAADQPAAA